MTVEIDQVALSDAQESKRMVAALSENSAFAWFLRRMEAQALATLKSSHVGEESDQACLARFTQAQTLASLGTTLSNLDKQASRVIARNTLVTLEPDEDDEDER